MNENPADRDDDELRRRLLAVEESPLDERAAALGGLHDELRSRLEGGDAPPHGS